MKVIELNREEYLISVKKNLLILKVYHFQKMLLNGGIIIIVGKNFHQFV